MRVALLLWVLLCVTFSVKAQNEELEQYFELMQRLEKERKQDSLGMMAPDFLDAASSFPKSDLHLWARYYSSAFPWRKQPDTSYQMLLSVHEEFKKRELFFGVMKSALSLGVISYYHINDINQSSEFYQYGIDRMEAEGTEEIGDSLNNILLCVFYNSLCTNNSNQGNYEKAMQLALKAKTLLDVIDNDRQEALVLMNLANINAALREYEISQQYNQELLELCRKMGHREFTSMALNNLAASFGNMGQIDSAVFYMEKAYELSKTDQNWKQMTLRASNIGFTKLKLKEYEEARKYLNEALEIANDRSLPREKITALHFLANLELELKNVQAAHPVLDQAREIIENGGRTEMLVQHYDLRHEYHKAKGDFKKGLDYYQKMSLLRDSLRSEKVKKEVQALQSKFEAAQSEKENLKLRQEAELAQVKLRQRNIFIALVIGLFSLISLIIYLLGRQREFREKQQAIINAQRLRRAQMNPHFFFNALTSIQSLVLDSNDKQKQLTYIGRFASLMRQTLEQSFQEFIPLEEEMESLENYLNLQQLRFDNKFDYNIEYDSGDLENIEVPSQMVQSLVENAIEHGFKNIDYQGMINIRLHRTDEKVFKIEVEDNGRGLQGSKSIHTSRSQQIIQERLKLFKEPQRYFLKLENAAKNGVKATVFAPYQVF